MTSAEIFRCVRDRKVCDLHRLLTLDASAINIADALSLETPLMVACDPIYNHMLFTVSLDTTYFFTAWCNTIECLLAHGADPNQTCLSDGRYYSPLEQLWSLICVGDAQLRTTRALLKAGADAKSTLCALAVNRNVAQDATPEIYTAIRLMLKSCGQTWDDYPFAPTPRLISLRACESACVTLLGVRKFRRGASSDGFEQIPRELVAQMVRALWAERWDVACWMAERRESKK